MKDPGSHPQTAIEGHIERDRTAAGLQYLLQEAADAGHLCVPLDQLLKRGEQFLSVSAETTSRALEALRSLKEIVVDDQTDIPVVYLTALFEAEATIARRLKAFLTVPVPEQRWDRHDLALELVQSLGIELTAEQLATLDSVLAERIAIITGGPGTGKTTLIRALTRIYEYLGRRVKLAAPTGRAARHLSGLTARSATTVHRLLRYNPANNRFEKNVHSPVETDVIIVDEASMMDVPLTSQLLQAMHPQMTLILVGDVDQLPSVGPGNLLADLINSGAIPAFVLRTIHRQVAESSIVQAAHRIRRGKPPILPESERLDHQTEFIFLNSSRPEQAQRLIVELCQKSIPDIFGYQSVRDIQVVTPMHKGPVGTIKLNQILQEALNPNPVALQTQGRLFKHNDKVMHLVNNYAKGVFNGEIGRITTIDNANDALAVEYDGNAITYHFSEVNELTLAYAITVHKSQGSEYPVVILPMVPQHRPLLQRNLLYTAVTRAQKLVVLVGSQRAFRIALDNDKPQTRFSFLAQRLASTPS